MFPTFHVPMNIKHLDQSDRFVIHVICFVKRSISSCVILLDMGSIPHFTVFPVTSQLFPKEIFRLYTIMTNISSINVGKSYSKHALMNTTHVFMIKLAEWK